MNKIKNTDHYYLIDGSGYIFRAYYALPPLTRKSDGMPTGAVSGFCNMLFKLFIFKTFFLFIDNYTFITLAEINITLFNE